ncbi:MAG: hypothetical protein FWF44_08590, partial [Defluviitaleaceae bacterium]|nr:hypothetical protein [Defluviitaleaceae bacterium]
TLGVDNSPRYPKETFEDTEDYTVYTSEYGVTMKQWKNANSTPQFLHHTIVDYDSWLKAKERMTPADDRIDWAWLDKNYKRIRDEGQWVNAMLWFGFDVTHSWVVGTERVLMAIVEEPEWLMDMFDHMLNLSLNLYDRMWDAGYTFDSVFWCDDMGYKQNQFFSLNTYREFLKPYHQRAIDWAHHKGIKAHMHSCGDVNPFVPELVSMGLDALNPLEVKAGMDPVALKQKFGDRLILHGGINALLYEDEEAICAEAKRILPIMKEHGGYIFSTDHSVPSVVSLEEFGRIVEIAKEYGKYD